MSGRKNRLVKHNIIDAESMGTSLTSEVTNIEGLDNIGLQMDWTGSPVGTFTAQVSANYEQDYLGNVTNAGTWADVAVVYWNGSSYVTTTVVPTSVGSPIFLDMTLLSAPWIRLVYTRSSSTGTLTTSVTGKMV